MERVKRAVRLKTYRVSQSNQQMNFYYRLLPRPVFVQHLMCARLPDPKSFGNVGNVVCRKEKESLFLFYATKKQLDQREEDINYLKEKGKTIDLK